MTDFAPTIKLASGVEMPQVALGTWPMQDEEVERVALQAFEIGYRHVDTAENYENERGVGAAVRNSGLDRSELFVTTKFNKKWHADPAAGVAANLERLALDYADLVLIHWPNPDQDRYVEAWEGLIKLREQGVVRAIGTSNFLPEHIDRLLEATGVAPELDQLEYNPWYQQREALAYNDAKGIVTEAWSPLGRGTMLSIPSVVEIAETLDRTAGQVILRWQVQHGLAYAAKSADAERLRNNLAVFDFELSADQMATLDGLVQPEGEGMDHLHPSSFGH